MLYSNFCEKVQDVIEDMVDYIFDGMVVFGDNNSAKEDFDALVLWITENDEDAKLFHQQRDGQSFICLVNPDETSNRRNSLELSYDEDNDAICTVLTDNSGNKVTEYHQDVMDLAEYLSNI